MTIPIRNLYYLLAYAWDRLHEANSLRVGDDDFSEIENLFGRVLLNGTGKLLKRGMERGYHPESERIAGIRGKLELSPTLKCNALAFGQTVCSFDDLTEDVLNNQILAQTLRELSSSGRISPSLSGDLQRILKRFNRVSPIRLSGSCFRRIQLHGNVAIYRLLLQVCHLYVASSAIDASTGKRVFKDFTQGKEMPKLFEKFLLNFYRREQNALKVKSRRIPWVDLHGDSSSVCMIPGMETDVYLYSASRRIVLDAKFYREPLKGNFGQDRVRSGHLYQLYAYIRNLELSEPSGPKPVGILIYPLAGRPVAVEVKIQGHPIHVRTVDLNRPWRMIHEQLLAIVKE